MENKKAITVEELKKQYEEAKQNCETLGEQLKIAQKEEEDRKKAQLALEKENRKKEVDNAFKNYVELLKKYIEDYGSYCTSTSDDNEGWWTNSFFRGFF